MITSNGILMVEPSSNVSAEPLIDELTRKMTAAWRQSRKGTRWRGWHICSCGVDSDNCDHYVGNDNGLLTNSLCIHYLAFHRNDIPKEELDKVYSLNLGGEEPTEEELHFPNRKPSRPTVYR